MFPCANETNCYKGQAFKAPDISSILKPNAFHVLKDVSLRFPFTHME